MDDIIISIDKVANRLKEIRFSFSSLSSFETCKYSWYLTYVERFERENNFFAQYGSLVHETLEKVFRREIESKDMVSYFESNWDRAITIFPPPFIKIQPYIEQAIAFFSSFKFNWKNWEPLVIEGMYDIENPKLVIKPDLVIRNKKNGKIVLLDYKTSVVEKKGVKDLEKINTYKRQMNIYVTYLLNHNIKVDEVWIWFIRTKTFEKYKPTHKDLRLAERWVNDAILEIVTEQDFEPSPDKFFCNNLCSVRNFCKYKP